MARGGHRGSAVGPRWHTALALLVVPALVATAPVDLLAAGPDEDLPARASGSSYQGLPAADHAWFRLEASLALAPAGDGPAVSSRGTRLWTASELSSHDLPEAAEQAYRRAAGRMARTDPGCRLPWTLLAGIGRVESDHGRYGGSRLGADGVSRPLIFGLRLDGTGPVAAIRDTDRGRLDRDRVWDRAVGPMQFIPATWAAMARDGDDDGRRSPHDLDDASAAAASYLCSGAGSLQDPGTQAAAIYRYNQDDYYVDLVQAFEVGYRTGVFVIPPPPVEDEPDATRRRQRRQRTTAARAPRTRVVQASLRQAPEASADEGEEQTVTAPTTKPKPSASPKPAPAPSASPTATPPPEPVPTKVVAVFNTCDGGYCLGGKPLDLGVLAQPDATAPGDLDKDGAVETNGAEIEGLLGTTVTMVLLALESGKYGILSVNGTSLG